MTSHIRRAVASLRRHTSSGRYIPELDGLRFVAIGSVYLYHLAGDILRHTSPASPHPTSFLFRLTQQLNVGVPLFFAISGLILGLPFAKQYLQAGQPVSLRRYFLRRITRLEPPYIAALVLFFCLKVLSQPWTATIVPHLAASLAYVHNIIYGGPSTINIVAWSLEVEVQFYILAPLLATVFLVRSASVRRLVIVLAIMAVTVIATGPDAPRNWHLSLLGNLHYFLTGFLLADFILAWPALCAGWRYWDLVSAVGWPLVAFGLVSSPQSTLTILPAFIVVLYLAALYGPQSRLVFGSPWIASVGGMCYSIYLLHNYSIAVIGSVTERIGNTLPFDARLALQVLLMSPAVVLVSVVYYRLIEQPCMQPDWPSRLARYVASRSEALRKIAARKQLDADTLG